MGKKDAPYLIDCTNKTTMKTNQCKDDGSTDIGNAKSTSNIINSNIKNALNNSDFTNKNIFFPTIEILHSGSPDELTARQTPANTKKTGFMYFKKLGPKSSTPTAFRYYDELLILPPQVYLYMAAKSPDGMTIEFDANEFKTSDNSVLGKSTNPLGNFSIKLTKDEDSYKQTLTEVNGMPVAPQLQKSLFSPLIDKSTIIEYDANHNSKTNTYERDEQKSWSLSMPSMSSMPSINLSDNSSKLEENIKIWKNHFVASYKEILAKLSKEILAKKEIKFNENEFLEEKELFKKDNDELSKQRIIVLAISRSIVLQEKFLEQIKNIIIAYDDAKGTIKKKLSRLGFTSELYDFVREVNRIDFEDHKDIFDKKSEDIEDEIKKIYENGPKADDKIRKETRGFKYLDALIIQMKQCYHLGDENSDYHKGIHLRKNCTHKLNGITKSIFDYNESSFAVLPRVAALFLDLYRSLIPGISPFSKGDKDKDYFVTNDPLGNSKTENAMNAVGKAISSMGNISSSSTSKDNGVDDKNTVDGQSAAPAPEPAQQQPAPHEKSHGEERGKKTIELFKELIGDIGNYDINVKYINNLNKDTVDIISPQIVISYFKLLMSDENGIRLLYNMTEFQKKQEKENKLDSETTDKLYILNIVIHLFENEYDTLKKFITKASNKKTMFQYHYHDKLDEFKKKIAEKFS